MSSMFRDPWEKREMWRKHPIFTQRFYARRMFPGFTLGTTAFILDVGWEQFSKAQTQDAHH